MTFFGTNFVGISIWALVVGCNCYLGSSENVFNKTEVAGIAATITYRPGALSVSENGLLLSRGLKSKIIAKTDEFVKYKDGSRSAIRFHDQPDAGAVFADESPTNAGG